MLKLLMYCASCLWLVLIHSCYAAIWFFCLLMFATLIESIKLKTYVFQPFYGWCIPLSTSFIVHLLNFEGRTVALYCSVTCFALIYVCMCAIFIAHSKKIL